MTANSRAMMMIATQAATSPVSTSETSTALIRSLSASGSRKAPATVTSPRERASQPSIESVAQATAKTAKAHHRAPGIPGTSSRTINGGIATIRTEVNHSGPFISPERMRRAYGDGAARPGGRRLGVGGLLQALARRERYQHAAVWPGANSASGGISVRQRSGTSSSEPDTVRAFGQRGWNGHPGGGLAGDGHVAVSTMRLRAAPRVALGHRRQQRRRVGVASGPRRARRPRRPRRCGRGTSRRSGPRRGAPPEVVRDEQVGQVALVLQVLAAG